jgi:hypothetical protein
MIQQWDEEASLVNRLANKIVDQTRDNIVAQIEKMLDDELNPSEKLTSELKILEDFWKRRHRIILKRNKEKVKITPAI